jgi:hypothetical protein
MTIAVGLVGRIFPASFDALPMDEALSEMTESRAELIECLSSAALPPPLRLYDLAKLA